MKNTERILYVLVLLVVITQILSSQTVTFYKDGEISIAYGTEKSFLLSYNNGVKVLMTSDVNGFNDIVSHQKNKFTEVELKFYYRYSRKNNRSYFVYLVPDGLITALRRRINGNSWISFADLNGGKTIFLFRSNVSISFIGKERIILIMMSGVNIYIRVTKKKDYIIESNQSLIIAYVTKKEFKRIASSLNNNNP